MDQREMPKPVSAAAWLNQLTESFVMLFEHRQTLAGLAGMLEAVKPEPADPFHAALFSYIRDGAASITAWHLLPNLWQYEQLKLKDEWDEEAINLASRADVPWQFLIAKFGNRAEVWQAVELSAEELGENWALLVDAGVNLESYRAKLAAH